MFWGADGYAHKTSNNLKKRTLDGYTGHNFPIFGDRKVTNIFSTDQIFFIQTRAIREVIPRYSDIYTYIQIYL